MLLVFPETQKLCVVIFNFWTSNQYDSKQESRIRFKNKRSVVPVLYRTTNFTERTLTRRDVVGMTDFRTWSRFFAYTFLAVVNPWPSAARRIHGRCLLALTFGVFVRVAASRISYTCTIYYGDLLGDGIDANTARTVAGHMLTYGRRSAATTRATMTGQRCFLTLSRSLRRAFGVYVTDIHTHTHTQADARTHTRARSSVNTVRSLPLSTAVPVDFKFLGGFCMDRR